MSRPSDAAVVGKGFYRVYGKRLLDLALAFSGILIALPVMTAVAVLARLSLGSPILFRQDRPGREGRLFTLCKFRTMTGERGKDGRLLSDGERLTPLGRFLRRTSLDELPELFNVLLGDMSLVGPRPLLPQYLERYTTEQNRRHEVKPGLTGWAQVNGRNAITWEEKFELDVWYVDHLSFSLDLRILLRTIAAVVRGEGVVAAGEATMPEFLGSRPPEGKGKDA